MDRVKLQCGRISVEHVVQMDCIFLTLKAKDFSSSNCNLYIKKWLAGEAGDRLKTLLIEDALEVGGGMHNIRSDLQQLEVAGPVKYRKGDFEAYVWEAKKAEKFDVVRKDGKRATICTHKADFMFYVRD